MEKAMDHKQLMRWIDTLPREGVSVLPLTRSIFSREIPMITVGRGKKTVVYVGAHHGMEGITAGVLADFVDELIRSAQKDRVVFDISVKCLLNERKIAVVPMLNPDGVEYALHGVAEDNPLRERVTAFNGGDDFSHWQANARGVDLNHNYDAGFSEYKKIEREMGIFGGAPTKYSGEYPESEPETAALCRFLRYHSDDLVGVLSLHTQGEEIFCNCADKMSAKTLAVGRMLARLTTYKLSEPQGTAAYGGLADWCIDKLSCPAYTLECGKGENPLPPGDRGKIYERLRRALFSFPYLV